jgi:hypothetical protein
LSIGLDAWTCLNDCASRFELVWTVVCAWRCASDRVDRFERRI